MFSLTQKDFVDDTLESTIEQRKKAPRLSTIGMHVFKVGRNNSLIHSLIHWLIHLQVEENRKYRLHEKPSQTAVVSEYIRTRTVLTKLSNVKMVRLFEFTNSIHWSIDCPGSLRGHADNVRARRALRLHDAHSRSGRANTCRVSFIHLFIVWLINLFVD